MHFKKIMTVVAALTISAAAMAADSNVNQNFVQLDYSMGKFKNDDATRIDTDGYRLQASYAVMPKLLLRGSYGNSQSDEKGFSKPDVDTTEVGISWLAPTGDENVSIDAGLVYRQDEFDVNTIDGIGVGLGLRAMASETVEVAARINWLEGEYDGSLDAEVGAAWHFMDHYAVNFGYKALDYKGFVRKDYTDRRWQLGFRYSF